MRVWLVCKPNFATDWLKNSHSTFESQSSSLIQLSRPSLLPHRRKKKTALQLRWLRAESDDNSL